MISSEQERYGNFDKSINLCFGQKKFYEFVEKEQKVNIFFRRLVYFVKGSYNKYGRFYRFL